ncbi:MAG: anaerobic sulfatase maturase [Bifidobacteriaceae bacterium]|jgi:uncharacterized protein|nr:anaerobic sulfatase maturase [Bifidobacteriaceae bacterium]
MTEAAWQKTGNRAARRKNKKSSGGRPQDNPLRPLFTRSAPRVHFSALAKPAGAACNLDCTYCFFLSKELLTETQQMSEEGLRTYLTNFLDSQPDGDVTIEWQGGEPTLRGVDFFEHAVELAEQLKRPGQQVHHAIQTNGTLLDDRWGKFLADNHFLVGISIDGPEELHDIYRVNRAGHGTQKQVIRGWNILKKYHVDTNILCTVHAGNEDHALEVYHYFRDTLGAQYIQFIPIVERVTRAELPLAEAGWHDKHTKRPLYRQEGSDVTSRSVEPIKWGKFLSDIYDEWVTRDVGKVFVQLFDVTLGNALGEYTLCTHAPVCGGEVAVLHTGEIYACDHWVEPGYERGNVATRSLADVVASPEQREFGMNKYTGLSEQCMKCPVRWACNGGCPKDRFVPAQDGVHQQNYLCPGYYHFFSHIQPDIEIMARMVQSNQNVAKIMDLKKAA